MEGKRERERERERDDVLKNYVKWVGEVYVQTGTDRNREINSCGLHGIGRVEFILRLRRIFLSRCNCNDDLSR